MQCWQLNAIASHCAFVFKCPRLRLTSQEFSCEQQQQQLLLHGVVGCDMQFLVHREATQAHQAQARCTACKQWPLLWALLAERCP